MRVSARDRHGILGQSDQSELFACAVSRRHGYPDAGVDPAGPQSLRRGILSIQISQPIPASVPKTASEDLYRRFWNRGNSQLRRREGLRILPGVHADRRAIEVI